MSFFEVLGEHVLYAGFSSWGSGTYEVITILAERTKSQTLIFRDQPRIATAKVSVTTAKVSVTTIEQRSDVIENQFQRYHVELLLS